jgi:hypothetical protein
VIAFCHEKERMLGMPYFALSRTPQDETSAEADTAHLAVAGMALPWTFNWTVAVGAMIVGLLTPVLCCDLPFLYVTHPDIYLCHGWGTLSLQRALLWARPVGTAVWATFARLPLMPYIAALHAFGILTVSLPFIALRMRTATALLAACAVVTHPEFINSNPHDTYTRVAFAFACTSAALFLYATGDSAGVLNRVAAFTGALVTFVASGLSKECYMVALPALMLSMAMRRSLRTLMVAAPFVIGCGMIVAVCAKLRGGAFVSGVGAYAISPPLVIVTNLVEFLRQCLSPALVLLIAAGLAVRVRQSGVGVALLELAAAWAFAMLAMLPNAVLPASHALSMYAAVAIPILAVYAAMAFDSRQQGRYERVTVASMSCLLVLACLWSGASYQKIHWWNLFNCKVNACNLHAMQVVRDRPRLPVGAKIAVFGLQQAHHSFLFAPMRCSEAIRGLWGDFRPRMFAGVCEQELPPSTPELTYFNTIDAVRKREFDLLVILDHRCDLLKTIEGATAVRAFIDLLEDSDICELFRQEDIERVFARAKESE